LLIELNHEGLTTVEQALICDALNIPFTEQLIEEWRDRFQSQTLRDFLKNLE